jgi:hypothetical protein
MTEEEWFSNWCPYQNYLVENSQEGLDELKEIVLLNDLDVSINKSLIS